MNKNMQLLGGRGVNTYCRFICDLELHGSQAILFTICVVQLPRQIALWTSGVTVKIVQL